MRKNSLFRTSVLALSLVTVLGMTACGSKNTSDNANTDTETKAVVSETVKQTEKTTENTTKAAESIPETEAGKEYETTAEGKLVTDGNGKAVEVTTPATEAPAEEVIVADNSDAGASDNNGGGNYEYVDVPADTSEDTPVEDTGSGNNGPSNTGNAFYDDYMNNPHMVDDADLIDKDSDPSKPCPYPLNTPIEGVYSGIDGSNGVYGDYPVYIVYNLCSDDATGGYARQLVIDTCYGGQSKVNGQRVKAYVSLPIGEYDCGTVRATYVSRY